MTLDNVLIVFGLTFDILGAYFLARGLITRRPDQLTYESTSGFGSPPNLRYISSALQQKSEAWIGFVFLVLGFLIQAMDFLFLEPPPSFVIPRMLALIGAVALGTGLFAIGRRMGRRLFRLYGLTMAKYLLSLPDEGLANADDWAAAVGKYLLPHLRREATEDDKTFAQRVREKAGSAPYVMSGQERLLDTMW